MPPSGSPSAPLDVAVSLIAHHAVRPDRAHFARAVAGWLLDGPPVRDTPARYTAAQVLRLCRQLPPPPAAGTRAPDLVQRRFTAPAPNRLWLVDFTYCPTWSGMVFTAFVHDAFSRRILGWRTATSMPTALPLDALEMALWTAGRKAAPTPAGAWPG